MDSIGRAQPGRLSATWPGACAGRFAGARPGHRSPWRALTVSVAWFPGGMSVSQCSKEDGRSSSGPAHETAAPKRTYDMMEGRVGRAIASASIEGGATETPGSLGLASSSAEGLCPSAPPGGRWGMAGPHTDGEAEAGCLGGPLWA